MKPTLIILGGLPGSGKTTIAKALASKINAIHLRIDTIEAAIKQSSLKPKEVVDAGYIAAAAIAEDNLRLGHVVIADSVNPVPESRNLWRECAKAADCAFIEVEIFCSDSDEHKKRVETRSTDVKGLKLPNWQDVQNRDYHKWETCDLRLDTAKVSANKCVSEILDCLQKKR